MYSNSDILLLDDPLSAVDAHVGKHIFDKVIGPKGLLKNKTRVFVTNSLGFLSETDEIVMLENGIISEMGSYEYLIEKNGTFSKFMSDFFQNSENKEDKNKNDNEIHKSSFLLVLYN